jgi:hypothetical protein
MKHSNSSGNLLNETSSNASSTTTHSTASKHFSITSLFGSNRAAVNSPSVSTFRRGSQPKSNPAATVVHASSAKASVGGWVENKADQKLTSSLSGTEQSDDGIDVSEPEFDTIFNLMDNYAALICSSFIHVDLISSLFTLGTEAKSAVSEKSRCILIKFLKIVANILPENSCAKLLTSPTLLELATAVGSNKSIYKSYKSNLILMDIANAFSIMPINQISNFVLTANGSALSSQSVSVRQRNGSSARTINNAAAGALSSRSNFPSLNIQTIFQLIEEIKVCSRMTVINAPRTASVELLNDIRLSLTPPVEKTDLNKQMDQSKVKDVSVKVF